MKTGQGFLLVFSITSQSSLAELAELREQIIRIKDDENVPIVIVGNKSDLEEDRVVSRARAFAMSQSWGNAPYYETSARRRGEGVIRSDWSRLIQRSKRRRGFCGPLQTDYSEGPQQSTGCSAWNWLWAKRKTAAAERLDTMHHPINYDSRRCKV